ncbi:MAG TPA: hypothetical protein PK765_06470 [bacterium]|nr:hypothetical protein [bacterium]
MKIVAVASPLVACSAGDFGAGTVGGVGSTATTIAGSAAGVISTPVTGAKDFAVGGAIDGVRQGLDLGESGYHK